jgi:hypothetical protein
MMTHSSQSSDVPMIERPKLLQYLKTGLQSKSYQFIRQAATAWLASYPGDLEINLVLVQGLVQEGRETMAAPILEKILRNDCEYLDALRIAEDLFPHLDAAKAQQAAGLVQALGAAPKNGLNLPNWGGKLFLVKKLFAEGQAEAARGILMEVMTLKDAPSLAGVLHLQLTEKENDLTARLNLGRVYHSRWPESIQISLLLASTWMESGKSDEAVNLLHECAALDPVGQVPARMWGDTFAYKPLYPETMQIVESFAIPSEVASKYGMNHLADGFSGATQTSTATAASFAQVEMPIPPVQPPVNEVRSFDGYQVLPTEEEAYPENPRVKEAAAHKKDPVIEEVEREFVKIADDLKTPSSARADSRFPSYVILTTKGGLTAQYGAQSTAVILDELAKLASSIQNTKNWHSFVFLPDDLTTCGKYGITPVDAIDPWKIKLALTDLDTALAKTGEMIGCVLIVGNDSVVPFHKLPNPTDDADATVPSDNPYGSLDKNYYVGDWPVGRLPGDSSTDSGLLLTQIRNLTDHHTDETGTQSWINQLLHFLLFWSQAYARNFTNLGYTAAIWQRASLASFRAIGEARNLYLCPSGNKTAFSIDKLNTAPFAYFNLHGVEDGPNWYGQKDTSDTSSGDDYPVALQPALLKKNSYSPRIVFSEACYGGHITGRTEADSIAMTFLGQGVLAMIASSTIAYGSVTTPLIGADLLGNLVMKYLVEGQPVGTALMKAKVDFVREMNLRQGYLDGEDQKTLISFILYGDPLIAYDPYQVSSKMIPREKDHPVVKTVVDQDMDSAKSSPISAKAIANAKEVASQYLPGIEYAEVHIHSQHVRTHASPVVGAGKSTSNQMRPSSRVVVSFSKQIDFEQHIHRQYASVTLDSQGKVVKLAISR